MAAWVQDELRRINGTDELEIAAVREDGTLRGRRPIWVVRVDDDLYVRAAYGNRSGWHRVARASGRARIRAGGVEKDVAVEDAKLDVLDRVDAAYRSKYGRYASIVDSITDAEHRASTVRLVPAQEAKT
jgi:hypothetical protein